MPLWLGFVSTLPNTVLGLVLGYRRHPMERAAQRATA
jgi:hypothetical protein